MATTSIQLTIEMLNGSDWVCEKRGTCKARLVTQDRNVIKRTEMTDIHPSHTHVPDCPRVEMIKGLSTIKHRTTNFNDTTRSILTTGILSQIKKTEIRFPTYVG